MKIGFGLFLMTLGAILRFAIDDSWDVIDRAVVGLILMIVGVVAFVTGVVLEFPKRQLVSSGHHAGVAGLPPSAPSSAQPTAPSQIPSPPPPPRPQ